MVGFSESMRVSLVNYIVVWYGNNLVIECFRG